MINYISNLEGLRDRLASAADWAPTQAAEFKWRATRWLNDALFALSSEAPWLFEETELSVVLEPPVDMATDDDTVSVTSDAWVMKLDLAAGHADATPWEDNRKWDGRTIAIRDADDDTVWHRHVIREVWTSGGNVYFSLDRPWPNTTDTELHWRILSPDVLLPENVIEVRSARLVKSANEQPLPVITQGLAEDSAYDAHPDSSAGEPQLLFRRAHRQLAQPNFQPVAKTEAEALVAAWLGPEPVGEFDYCFTYIWGKQESRMQLPGPAEQASTAGATSRYTPYLESGPSPVSDPVTLPSSGAGAITITLPDYDFLVGFGGAATTRYRRAGVKKAIYRRRKQETAATKVIDPSDRFYKIDEVDGHVTTWTDNGALTPDRKAPLLPTQQYKAFGVYPQPDARYELRLRVVARPWPLVDDGDIPRIPADAVDVLVFKALMSLTGPAQGNPGLMTLAEREFSKALARAQRRHGNPRTGERPFKRGMARTSVEWFSRQRYLR